MSVPDHIEDRKLFSLIAEGDETAFRTIFSRYGATIYPFLLDMVKQDATAREMVQEVFLKIWLKREMLPSIEKPAFWIYRIASNLAISHLKRKQVEAKVLSEITDRNFNISFDSLTDELNGKELQGLIHKAIEKLPPQRRKVFSLIREQGHSRRETATILGISENTVKSHLDAALKSIQTFIQNTAGPYIPVVLLLHFLPK